MCQRQSLGFKDSSFPSLDLLLGVYSQAIPGGTYSSNRL